MLNLAKCLNSYSIEDSVISLVNKIAYDKGKGITTSHDQQNYWDFGLDILKKTKIIRRQIESNTFKFSPLLRIERTVNTRTRIIYIPTWEDKIVDRWLYNAVNKRLNNWFTPGCYAYRISGVFGVNACQNSVALSIRNNQYFIKRDISNYFYSIDHDILLNQIRELVDQNDYLFDLIYNRIRFSWINDQESGINEIGVPFGCASACLLANIHLHSLDVKVSSFLVKYYRYADDFLITGSDPEQVLGAANCLDKEIADRKLLCKPSHSHNYSFIQHKSFELIKRFKYLGLEFCSDGQVRLSIEKQRKIRRLYTLAIKYNQNRLRDLPLDKKIIKAIEICNGVLLDRIRSIAIVDYYLVHITDENQLIILDRLIMEDVISFILNRKFKQGLLKHISFKTLRKHGLMSLVHRFRLIQHGHIKVNFLSLRNTRAIDRYIKRMESRREKINYIRISRKNVKSKINS